MGRIIEILVILVLPSLIAYHIGAKNVGAVQEPEKVYIPKTVYKDKIVKVPVEKIVEKVVHRDVPVEKTVYRDRVVEKVVEKPVIKTIYKDRVQKKYITIENNVPILVVSGKVTATEAIRHASEQLGWISPRQQDAIRGKFSDGKRHNISLALRVD